MPRGTRGTRRSTSTRRGRSKSPTKASPAKTSPAKTRSRTRSTRKPKAESSTKSKAVSPVPLKLDELKKTKPSAKTVTQTIKNVNKENFVLDPVTVCRIHYVQLFFVGLFLLLVPHLLPKPIHLKKEYMGKGLEFEMRWFGATAIAFSMQLMAAAQGTYAEQRKSLQYGMIFWILSAFLTISQNHALIHREASFYGTAYLLANLSMSIWACYYHNK